MDRHGGSQLRGAAADRRLVLAGALADPTRLRLYEMLEDAAQGVARKSSDDRGQSPSEQVAYLDVATLTAKAGVHHSTVRSHLARLRDAGLIKEWVAPPNGRGRPKLLYQWLDPVSSMESVAHSTDR